LRIDLHAHTSYSPDSILKPSELIERARAAGLDRIAVTDHNSMDGAYEARALAPDLIILGEEIDCAEGTDLIGLFMHEPIPAGLSVEETARRIRKQGGIVYAPHPFAYLRNAADHAERVMAVADVVEVFNGRAFLPRWNRNALAVARAAKLPTAAGSDSHFGHEIGGAWTELPAFSTRTQFRQALVHARPHHSRQSGPHTIMASASIEIMRRVMGRGPSRRGGMLPSQPTGQAA
jgi:predicted metal-dependent phosphoesterase TrpH